MKLHGAHFYFLTQLALWRGDMWKQLISLWTQPLFIFIPRLLTWWYYFFVSPPFQYSVATISHYYPFIYHKVQKGWNPPSIPWTCLLPFDFSGNFLSINFQLNKLIDALKQNSWPHLPQQAPECFKVNPSII